MIKFLFIYYNFIMRSKYNENKTSEVVCHLLGSAFDDCCSTYSQDEILLANAKYWVDVGTVMISRFSGALVSSVEL